MRRKKLSLMEAFLFVDGYNQLIQANDKEKLLRFLKKRGQYDKILNTLILYIGDLIFLKSFNQEICNKLHRNLEEMLYLFPEIIPNLDKEIVKKDIERVYSLERLFLETLNDIEIDKRAYYSILYGFTKYRDELSYDIKDQVLLSLSFIISLFVISHGDILITLVAIFFTFIIFSILNMFFK